MSTKKENKRRARKRALRVKHTYRDNNAKRDSMSAPRRGYGLGIGR